MSETGALGAGGLPALRRAYLRQRYAFLFYTLLLTMVAAPVFAAFELKGALIELFLAGNLLVAVMPVSAVRSRRVLFSVVALVCLLRPATLWFNHPALSVAMLGVSTLIGLLAAASALRFAMRAESVDAEHLYAALSAYLLAGIFFGQFYWVLEQVGPGSFAAVGDFSRA